MKPKIKFPKEKIAKRLHPHLAKRITAGGRKGAVARAVAKRLHPDFEERMAKHHATQDSASTRAAVPLFVNIVQFPAIKPGKDAEFRDWFTWSNAEYAKHKGFISRKLLKPRESGNYAAVVEHESFETFWAMHTSSTQAEAAKRVQSLLDGEPSAKFYEVVIG